MKPSNELVRLAKRFNELGIAWHDNSDESFYRVQTDKLMRVRTKLGHRTRNWCSAVDGPYSFSRGVGIEAWIAGHDDPEWYETADDVLEAMGVVQS